MRKAGLGALLFDLLTHEEESVDLFTRQFRFDIDLLARRLEGVTNWLAGQPDTEKLAVGYFGASTGAAAALVAAARLGERIGAVVSRGGRPDLAEPVLPAVKSPTLLIVGERDERVIELNERAYGLLRCEKDLRIVPRATHLFEEAGALEEVSRLAANWFRDHLHRIH
jgi:pimeloyl-ACP methyl ester carboxylesterase